MRVVAHLGSTSFSIAFSSAAMLTSGFSDLSLSLKSIVSRSYFQLIVLLVTDDIESFFYYVHYYVFSFMMTE